MLFLNGGVKLTTDGSPVIESLKILMDSGTEIMSCGTCLDFYGLKDKLAIGTVTNMYTIVEKMNKASNTIKL
jgi:peroxiredoxin family protein